MKRSDMAPSHDAAPSWVRRYYPIPDPLATFEQAERWRHLDVPGRSDDALRAELNRITLRLLYDPKPSPWLLERRAVLRREIGQPRWRFRTGAAIASRTAGPNDAIEHFVWWCGPTRSPWHTLSGDPRHDAPRHSPPVPPPRIRRLANVQLEKVSWPWRGYAPLM